MEKFDNEERRRYYGLRKGDIVQSKAYHLTNAEVVEYGFMDNNAVWVCKTKGAKPIKVVAELCTIVTKVEDRTPSP